MPEVYEMTPAGTVDHPKPEVYEIAPSGAVEQPKPGVYEMTPTEGPEAQWIYFGTYSMDASRYPTLHINGPGNYSGLESISMTGYSDARVVGIGGVWTDILAGITYYHGFMGVCTRTESENTGSGHYRTTLAEASAEWVGQTKEVSVGSDGTFAWGLVDDITSAKTGVLTFKLYGLKEV